MRKTFGFLLLVVLLIAGTVSAQVGSGKGGDDDDPTPTPAPDTEPTDVPTDTTLAITIAEPDAEDVVALLEQGSQPVSVDGLLRYETFDADDGWELYEDTAGYLRVENGRYTLFATEEFGLLWGQETTSYTDTVMQVQTNQLSDELNNGYGLMCRADLNNNSVGYHCWISGDGYAAIILVTEDDAEWLVEWERSDLINQGQAQNEITAVCSGDYFALYINGTLALEATDDTFSEGAAGLSAITFEEGTDVEIAYDEVRIWDATGATSSGGGGTALGSLIGSSDRDGDQGEPEPTPSGGLSGLFGSSTDSDNDSPDAEATRDDLQEALAQSGGLELGDLLLFEMFDEEDSWELFEFEDGTGWLRVIDGEYVVYNAEPGIFWGLGEDVYGDVVIEVDAALTSGDETNGYGIMCRADPANTIDGYHFYVSGDGFYAIAVAVDGEVNTLVDFEASSAINENPGVNRLAVVCVDSYLALYINGELVEELTDDTYSTGGVGLTTVMFEDTEEVRATFDNLRIYEVSQ